VRTTTTQGVEQRRPTRKFTQLAQLCALAVHGKPHGPFNIAQFEKLIRGNAVSLDTEVSADGKAWLTLREALAGLPDANSSGWADNPTLLPGDVKLPPLRRGDPKPDAPS